MEVITFGGGRRALRFGEQKINLHLAGAEFEPKADPPVPGSEDVCLITKTDLDEALAHVESCGVEIIEGPGEKSGAVGPIRSFYFRDPGREFDRDIELPRGDEIACLASPHCPTSGRVRFRLPPLRDRPSSP